jgi:hypothetical protein
VAGAGAVRELGPGLAKLALDTVPHDRVADRLRHREAEPRLVAVTVLPREPVEDEEARRRGAAAPVDGVEVPRPGQAVAALHVLEDRRVQ